MLNVTRHWRREAGVGLVLIALLGVGLAAYTRVFSDEQPGDGALIGVSADELSAGGIRLSKPAAEFSPQITDSQAREAAVKAAHIDAAVKEVVLSQLKYDVPVPAIDEPMWIVSFDVAGKPGAMFGPPGSPPTAPMKYLLVFVDPNSGAALRMVRVTEPGFWIADVVDEPEAAP
jgi:hypothetical protein